MLRPCKNNLDDGSLVSRFEVSRTDPPVIDPKSEKVLLKFWSGGHNGGCLDFGNDGYLYISTGDGTDPSPPDSKLTGQDCSDLLSSILRIDVDHSEPGKGYRVPADNPFVKTPGVRPEIWAFGFRNPWRMSIDRATGDLWVGDVGWELWEMIYRVERGGNYGWSVMEGPQPVHVEGKRGPAPILPPVDRSSPLRGGFDHRRLRLSRHALCPSWRAPTSTAIIRPAPSGACATTARAVTWQQELARTPLHLAAFGETNDGRALTWSTTTGRTRSIAWCPTPAQAQVRLPSPTERDRAVSLDCATIGRPRASFPIPSTSALWSDGAHGRAVPGAYPGNGRIALDEQGNWRFPEGSVLARTVSIELEKGKPASRRRIETQVLHLEAESWRPYTYVWTDDQSDAVLADAEGLEPDARPDRP